MRGGIPMISRNALFCILLLGISALVPGAQTTPGPGSPGLVEKLGGTAALDVTLRDETGREVTLASIVDKPTVLNLVFFRCAGICSPLLNGLVDGLNGLDMEQGKDFQVVTVSFDPGDTPEVATRKRQNYVTQLKRPCPESGWRFLTGDAAQTLRLCDSVGFYFKRDGDQFVHPAALIFLSPKGRIVRYMYGIRFLPFDMKMAVAEASEGRIGTTVQKALQLCFSYDPAGKRYVLDVTRIAAVVTAVLVLAFLLALLLWRKKIDSKETAP